VNDISEERMQNPSQFNRHLNTSSEGINLLVLLLAIVKRPWILVGTFLIIIIPLVFQLSKVKTVYRSSSVIMVSIRETSVMDAISLVEGRRSDIKTEKYYTSILDSKNYDDEIVANIVDEYPEFNENSISGIVKTNIGYITNSREPGFINIYAKSQSEELSLILAQIALDVFIFRSIELERKDAIHISEFIDKQVMNTSKKLEEAERQLQSFLAVKNINIIDDESGITHELIQLEQFFAEADANLEMIKLNILSFEKQISELFDNIANESNLNNDIEIIRLKGRLAEIRETLHNFESLNLNQSNIQTLKDERERVRTELINLVANIATNGSSNNQDASISLQKLENKLEEAMLEQTGAQNQVLYYEQQIDHFKAVHPNLSNDVLEYANLIRSEGILQKTLDILLEKQEEVRIRVESEMGGIRVIDEPRIEQLARERWKKLILGIIASFAIGIVICIMIDRFDDAIKDDADIQDNFGLPVLGTIPSIESLATSNTSAKHIKLKKKRGRAKNEDSSMQNRLITNYSEKSPLAEAYRSAKIAIQFLAKDKSLNTFVISSPSMSEGKSLTTSNLAISFAQGGHRILIIDCDLRKSVIHKYFNIERKPGLTNYMYDEVELKDIIRDSGINNLSLITSGSSSTNPAELLASQKMRDLIETFRTQYDIILIDTPPVLVCSDSRILADTTDGIIMIAKVESTRKKALDHALESLNTLDNNILGFIINQIEFRFNRMYYYSYHYYKPYSYYSGYYYNRQYYDYVENETEEDQALKS